MLSIPLDILQYLIIAQIFHLQVLLELSGRFGPTNLLQTHFYRCLTLTAILKQPAERALVFKFV